jgi:hypothetical protein
MTTPGDPVNVYEVKKSKIHHIIEKPFPFEEPLFKKKHRSSPAIQTTLYELMETVIDVADPEEGKLVNDVTIHILKKAKPGIRISAH